MKNFSAGEVAAAVAAAEAVSRLTCWPPGRLAGAGAAFTASFAGAFSAAFAAPTDTIADSANSGVIFNIKEDPKYKNSWYTGLEMQVLDDEGHPDRKWVSHRAGCLYDLIAVSQPAVKPAGQWNKAEIVLNKGDLKLYLNGINVVSTTMWTDDWKKLVAGSKFKDMPDFATYHVGRIGLQDHGNQVWFRNIKIRKL